MRRLHHNLTVQVLVAITLGVLLGLVAPATGRAMRPLGDVFINLVKMVIAPVIFLTIVLGIANMRDLKQVGRVGGKALLYFEIVSTLSLAIGLLVVNLTQPGAGLDVSALAKGDVSAYTGPGKELHFVEFVTHIVPTSAVDAFAKGDVLQVVFFAVLFGVALASLGAHGRPFTDLLELGVLGVLMLTSKGAAGVTGSGFIVLASTLSAMHVVPVEGVAILLGVDRFMSEARAITNLIGNGAATLVIARSEQAFDDAARERAVAELHAERMAGLAA